MRKISILVSLVVFLLVAVSAEARLGGGGRSSYGSRGSRGFGSSYNSFSRSAPMGGSQLSRPMAQPQNMYAQPPTAGRSFMSGIMGGLAGGMLGSMLFRSLGYAGAPGMAGGGGFGLLEMLLVGALIFILVRMFLSGRTRQPNYGAASFSQPETPQQGASYYGSDGSDSAEEAMIGTLKRYNPAFDPQRFKEERTDEFFIIQGAWGKRDLAGVRSMLTSDLAQELDTQVADLKSAGKVNRLENIAMRETQIVEAWQEFGKEFVTLRYIANALDYTVDEKNGAVIEGNATRPTKYEEFWTYARELSGPGQSWKLSAIEQV